MNIPIHFEVFSTGMKARLSPTYRKDLEIHQQQGQFESRKDLNKNNQTTLLPFTTKTRAYGTYVWRKL